MRLIGMCISLGCQGLELGWARFEVPSFMSRDLCIGLLALGLQLVFGDSVLSVDLACLVRPGGL